MDCLLKPKELQDVHVGELLEVYCSLTKELFITSQDRWGKQARQAFGETSFFVREPLTTLQPSSIVAIMSLSALPKQRRFALRLLVHPLLQGQGMMQRILSFGPTYPPNGSPDALRIVTSSRLSSGFVVDPSSPMTYLVCLKNIRKKFWMLLEERERAWERAWKNMMIL